MASTLRGVPRNSKNGWGATTRTRARGAGTAIRPEASWERSECDGLRCGARFCKGRVEITVPSEHRRRMSETGSTIEHAPELSVVVPMYNESESVGPLVDAVRDALGDASPW